MAASPAMMPSVSLEPIYGNGWLAMPDEAGRDVPAPFDVELHHVGAATGTIVTARHEFEGGSATFSSRYKETTEFVNVHVSRDGTPLACGYAKLLVDR